MFIFQREGKQRLNSDVGEDAQMTLRLIKKMRLI